MDRDRSPLFARRSQNEDAGPDADHGDQPHHQHPDLVPTRAYQRQLGVIEQQEDSGTVDHQSQDGYDFAHSQQSSPATHHQQEVNYNNYNNNNNNASTTFGGFQRAPTYFDPFNLR